MSEIQANTITKHVKLKAVIEEGQDAIALVSKRGNEHPCLHIMELAEGREFLTQCLVALNVANSPEPSKPKKEKGSVQVKLVGTLPKDTPEPVDEFKRMLQETGIQAGDTILTAVLRNCQHSWHIDDARDTPTCPGCDAEA